MMNLKTLTRVVSVSMIVLLAACKVEGSVEGGVRSDPMTGNPTWEVKGKVTFTFGKKNLSGAGSDLALVLAGLNGKTPALIGDAVALSVLSEKGEVLGEEVFGLVSAGEGVYVLKDPQAADAWLAKFGDASRVGFAFNTEYVETPFSVSVYGGGVELLTSYIGR